MVKRLNDTAAIATMPMKGDSENVSIDIRTIDNGYIVRESHYNQDGYTCKETYSPTKPTVDKSMGGKSPMKAATDYLNRK